MPVYEYKCTVCEQHLDVEQSFTDDALTTLDGCETDERGRHRLKKVFSAVGISFKGDGFYRNDARAGAGKSNGSQNGTTSSNGDSSSDSTSSSESSSGDSTSSSASSSGDSNSSSSSSDQSKPKAKSTSSSSTTGGSKSD